MTRTEQSVCDACSVYYVACSEHLSAETQRSVESLGEEMLEDLGLIPNGAFSATRQRHRLFVGPQVNYEMVSRKLR